VIRVSFATRNARNPAPSLSAAPMCTALVVTVPALVTAIIMPHSDALPGNHGTAMNAYAYCNFVP
jgi:hypothetical protein